LKEAAQNLLLCNTGLNGVTLCLKKVDYVSYQWAKSNRCKINQSVFFQFSKNPLEVKHLFSYITIECKTHCCLKLQPTNRVAANPRISSYTFHSSEWESTSCLYQVWAIHKPDTNTGTILSPTTN